MTTPASVSEDFAAVVTIRESTAILDTKILFNSSYDDSDMSPIDQFIVNTLPLNKMWSTIESGGDLEPQVGILLLLGYVSAVESYMRAIIRRLITCDRFSQKCCEKFQLSFGAAVHHRYDLLPEALLEETVFTGENEITKALKKFIGYELSNKAIQGLLGQYEKVCQLRHCCVHRFGKLGAKNAIELGLQSHKEFLEKPVHLTKHSIELIADLLFLMVKSINNDVFRHVLIRSATGQIDMNKGVGIGWTWDKSKDRKLFARYYSVFSSQEDSLRSPTADELYARFKKVYRGVGTLTKK